MAAIESEQLRADPGGRSLRATALMSGTLGLLAIGALALMVTPDRANSPSAVQTPASFVTVAELSATVPVTASIGLVPVTTAVFEFAVGELAGALGVTRPGDDAVTSTTFTVAADPEALAAPLATPLATPLESSERSGLAIVTTKAIAGTDEGDTLTVQLASGRVVEAEVIDAADQATLVRLGAEATGEPAVELADATPGADSMVTLLLDTPVRLPMSALAEIGAPEGTAVVDTDGRLIGLCTLGDDGATQLATVDAGVDPAGGADDGVGNSTAPTESPEPPVSTAPVTTVVTSATVTVTTTVPGATTTVAPERGATAGSGALAPNAP